MFIYVLSTVWVMFCGSVFSFIQLLISDKQSQEEPQQRPSRSPSSAAASGSSWSPNAASSARWPGAGKQLLLWNVHVWSSFNVIQLNPSDYSHLLIPVFKYPLAKSPEEEAVHRQLLMFYIMYCAFKKLSRCTSSYMWKDFRSLIFL